MPSALIDVAVHCKESYDQEMKVERLDMDALWKLNYACGYAETAYREGSG
jgi:hypothetical protein